MVEGSRKEHTCLSKKATVVRAADQGYSSVHVRIAPHTRIHTANSHTEYPMQTNRIPPLHDLVPPQDQKWLLHEALVPCLVDVGLRELYSSPGLLQRPAQDAGCIQVLTLLGSECRHPPLFTEQNSQEHGTWKPEDGQP